MTRFKRLFALIQKGGVLYILLFIFCIALLKFISPTPQYFEGTLIGHNGLNGGSGRVFMIVQFDNNETALVRVNESNPPKFIKDARVVLTKISGNSYFWEYKFEHYK